MDLIFPQIPCFLPYCLLKGEYCGRKNSPKHPLKLLHNFSCCEACDILDKHQAAGVTSSFHNVCVIAALWSVFLLWSQTLPEAIMLLLAHGMSETLWHFKAFRHQCVTNNNGMGKVSRTWVMVTSTLEFSLRPLASICVFRSLIIKFS